MMRIVRILAIAVSILFITPVGPRSVFQAQVQQVAMPLAVEQVKPGLYAILNPGGNTIAVRVTNQGVVLVDDMPEMYFSEVREKIRSITNQPVRYVINTHHHNDHTGGSPQFKAANTIIVGHDGARARAACGPNANVAGAPEITYKDQAVIHLGDAEIQLHHLGRGHTDGDTIVYFPDLKVIATGDLFTAYLNPPRIEPACGGSSFEWLKTMDKVLSFDFDRVIPGHGAVSSKEDVAKKRKGMEVLQLRTMDLIRRGVPKEQYRMQLKIDDLGWTLGLAFGGDGWSTFWDEMAASIKN